MTNFIRKTIEDIFLNVVAFSIKFLKPLGLKQHCWLKSLCPGVGGALLFKTSPVMLESYSVIFFNLFDISILKLNKANQDFIHHIWFVWSISPLIMSASTNAVVTKWYSSLCTVTMEISISIAIEMQFHLFILRFRLYDFPVRCLIGTEQ